MRRRVDLSAPLTFAVIALAVSYNAWAQDLPLNPAVVQETVQSTICVPGYSKSIRPKVSYTNGIKIQRVQEMGLPPELIGDFILDHRIPISLGGSPTSEKNLILQDLEDSHRKDSAEYDLHHKVCTGQVTLAEAQRQMWSWK